MDFTTFLRGRKHTLHSAIPEMCLSVTAQPRAPSACPPSPRPCSAPISQHYAPYRARSAAGLTHNQRCPYSYQQMSSVDPKPARQGCVSCMVYLLCNCPRAQRSSRNMQAAGTRPGLFSNDVEGEYTSRARRPTLPCATRTEPRESYFSGCPRWVMALCLPPSGQIECSDTHSGSGWG